MKSSSSREKTRQRKKENTEEPMPLEVCYCTFKMGKKTPHFSKMVCEALSTADDEKGMNAKMVLDFIKQKHSIGNDDKANLDLIFKELQRGKAENEYLQIKGNSVHGFFTFNCFYVPPEEPQTKGLPDYFNPPEPSAEPVQALEPKKKKKQKKDKSKEEPKPVENTEGESEILRFLPNGRVEKGELDKFGNMKFSLYKPMPRLSRNQMNRMFSTEKSGSMDPEEAEKLANDPMFRRMYSQTGTVNIDPVLQAALDNASVGKKKSMLKGDKTDRIRLGLNSHADEQSDDDEQPSGSGKNASQKSDVDSAQQELSKMSVKPKLHPEVQKIIEEGTISALVDDLKSPDSKTRFTAMQTLLRAAPGTKHQQTALVELGAVPALVACISVDDPASSNAAISNLIHLCKNNNFCKLMFEARVAEKVLELTTSDAYKSEEAELWQLTQLFPLCFQLAISLVDNKWKIERTEFHALLTLQLDLIETSDDGMMKLIFQPLWALLVTYLTECPEHVWRYEFPDSKIEFICSKLGGQDMELNEVLLRFFRIVILHDGIKYVPFLAKLGFVDKLVQLLEHKELASSILGCIRHIVEERADGYKHIYDAGIVPKILPLLGSSDNQVIKDCAYVFASLIETKYTLLVPELTFLHIMHLQKVFDGLGLMKGDLANHFCKLHDQVLKRREHDLRKTIKKVKRKNLTLDKVLEEVKAKQDAAKTSAEKDE